MSQDCTEWLSELRQPARVVLGDDLAALSRRSDRQRIEMYNRIKSNEDELLSEFQLECPNTLMGDELDAVRSRFRLARLLVVASFALEADEDGVSQRHVPDALADEFAEQAITAALAFERYKQFDALSEDQINRRIRRMEGEVYELVTEYTNTQLSNLDELLESPEVQQDVIERLTERYEERLEKIRQGFYTYVEEQGLQGMVSAIEDAIQTVSDAQETSSEVDRKLARRIDELSETVATGFERQARQRRRQLQSVERELASSNPDVEALRDELASLDSGSQSHDRALDELQEAIAETKSLRADLESELENLREAKERSDAADEDDIATEVAAIVDSELEELASQREKVSAEVERLQQERERLEASREQVESRQAALSERLEEIRSSVSENEGGLDGDDVVTPPIARLLEMDYIGRFETSVHDARSIRVPDGSRDIPEGYWESRSERRNERPRLANFLDESQDPERFPVNVSARFTIESGGFLGLGGSPEMILEAAVCSDLEAHAVNGFDATPATLDDLLGYVNRSVYEANQTDVDILLGVASPTGWTDAVRRQITQGELARTKYSRRLSLVLVDAQSGELIYDDSDPVASENARLFELPVDSEALDACEADVEERLHSVGVGSDGVLLDTVAEEEDYPPHIVKRTFDQLATRHGYEQQYVDGDLVLFAD